MEGVEISSGEWIYFMDSDDELTPFCVSTLYKTQKADDADCANASFAKFKEGRITHNAFTRERTFDHR